MTTGRRLRIAAVVVLPVVALAVAAAFTYLRFPGNPDSLDISGYTGRLGEWEVTAAVVRTAAGDELAGPLTMRHVGLCTQEGPQEKTGELRLRLSSFTPQVVPGHGPYEINIRQDDASHATLLWTTNAIGWTLESTGSLVTPNWRFCSANCAWLSAFVCRFWSASITSPGRFASRSAMS